MKKQLFLTSFILFLSGFIFLMPNALAASSDPVNLLQSIANRMIASLKANRATLKTNRSLVYSLAYKIIVPYADLDEMSKRVLPPRTWQQASSAQRQEFKNQFTRILVRTYASALADYSDQTVQFYPVRGSQGHSIQVNSKIIRSNGPSIPVSYRLVNNGNGWRLYDMSVEGVSMLQSFHSQFAGILGRGNMSDLNHTLGQHNMGR